MIVAMSFTCIFVDAGGVTAVGSNAAGVPIEFRWAI
jgi:hypothetical protein